MRNLTISPGTLMWEALDNPSNPGDGLTSRTLGPSFVSIRSTPAMETDNNSHEVTDISDNSEERSDVWMKVGCAPNEMLCLCSNESLLIAPKTWLPRTKILIS